MKKTSKKEWAVIVGIYASMVAMIWALMEFVFTSGVIGYPTP